MRRQSRLFVLLATCALALVAAPTASAACTAAQRADTKASVAIAAAMRSANAPGAADVTRIVDRARRSCLDARPARAIATATRSVGHPAPGRRARVLGVDLIGVGSTDGVWRLDVERLAARVAAARTEHAAIVLRAQLRAAGFGTTAIAWSDDPTTSTWNPARQANVAAALARSSRSADRLLALASTRAFARRDRLASLGTQPLLAHVRIANTLALAALRAGDTASLLVARAVAQRTFTRIRAARNRGWSRIDGHWSSAAEHRALVTQAGVLLARVPNPATAKVVTALRTALRTPPSVDFGALPTGDFYPWPRDAAFDTQSVGIDVDKPASLTLTVYAADERVVRTVQVAVEPGATSLAWDGADSTGAILGAGEYRYNIDAVDLAGNSVRVPGLQQFVIARDTTPPVVRTAKLRHLLAAGQHRLVATWEVTEDHSPQVRTWLLLQRVGGARQSIQLHTTLQRASVRRDLRLAAGTWRATFVFLDGSGNRTSAPGGSIVVR